MSDIIQFHIERKGKKDMIQNLHVWIGCIHKNDISPWAFVYSDGKRNTFLSGKIKENNIDRVYLNIILEFLEWINPELVSSEKKYDITLYTNNTYSVNIISEWLEKWMRTDFKLDENTDRPNADLLRKISKYYVNHININIHNIFVKNEFTEKIKSLCDKELM